jgi:hypothetical protein
MFGALWFSTSSTAQLCKGFLALESPENACIPFVSGELVANDPKTRALARPWKGPRERYARRYKDRGLGHWTTLQPARTVILDADLEELPQHRLSRHFSG